MSESRVWLLDPQDRWPTAASTAERARRLPCPPGHRARLVDGARLDALRTLALDVDPAPVIALIAEDADDAGDIHDAAAVAALDAGADAVLSAAELRAGGLERAIARGAARRAATHRLLRRRAAELGATDATLASLGRSVSHDLRAPLRTLDGFGQALVEDFGPDLDPDARMYVDRMRAATVRLDQRLDAVLRLTQMVRRPFQAEAVDLGALFADAVAHHRTLNPGRAVEWTGPGPHVVTGDRRLLEALAHELVANAWTFTGPRDRAHVRLTIEGGRFTLTDDGVGFAPSYAETIMHLFGRYHTAEEFPGDGVGLAVATTVVERHGGWLIATGEEGSGAAFTFALDPDVPRPD